MSEGGSSRRGRGGGRSGGRGKGPVTRDVQVSKQLCWLLRHGAESEGLKLQEGGFVGVVDVLNNRKLRSIKATWPEIIEIVSSNDKQRFTIKPIEDSPDPTWPPAPTSDPAQFLIRANQGHSIKLESAGLLTPITEENLPSMCVHGTTFKSWESIVKSGGLKLMGRNHVHFARGLPEGVEEIIDSVTEKLGSVNLDDVVAVGVEAESTQKDTPSGAKKQKEAVISGMRKASTILIYIDLHKATNEKGIKFWISDNGVVLSEGDEKGLIPVEVFKKVEDRKNGVVLVQDGVLLKA